MKTHQLTEAARMGVELLISPIHPAGASGWTLEDEKECLRITAEWAKQKDREGPRWRQSRQSFRRQLRIKGLPWGIKVIGEA